MAQAVETLTTFEQKKLAVLVRMALMTPTPLAQNPTHPSAANFSTSAWPAGGKPSYCGVIGA